MEPLRAQDVDLRDLARGEPALPDALGRPTGIRLVKWLGAGGMSAVFEARAEGAGDAGLSPLVPGRLAVKLLKPVTVHKAQRLGLAAAEVFTRETTALGRIMARQTPTELVVGYYGSGEA